MLKHYFTLAWRNLWKHKLFSIINILGLGLALPFALISIMQVVSVYESDDFHPHPERTYRIITDVQVKNGSAYADAFTPSTLSQKLADDYPAVEEATYVLRPFGWELTNQLKTISVNSIFVEPQFFNMFGFVLQAGVVPAEPNTLAITQAMAEVFFGKEDAIGKTLIHPDYGEMKITAILKPYKRGTHLRSDVMVSMATHDKIKKQKDDAGLEVFSYVRLQPQAREAQLQMALNALANNYNDVPNHQQSFAFRPQLVRKISPGYEDLRNNSYVESLLDLSVNFALALTLLLLAAFNYINLTLARAVSRAKEVGVRKVAGAKRYQIVAQFICEAILVSLLALLVGFVGLKTIERFSYVPWFAWEVDHQLALWVSFIVFTISVGAAAGFVPAKILSALLPVKVLKGTVTPASFGRIGFRNTLVVMQFVVTACFIFVLATMFGQFRYMATDNENFNRENIYNIAVSENYKPLLADVQAHADVASVGMVSNPFGGTSAQCVVNKDQREAGINASYYAADASFISNMQLNFVAGANLMQSSSDSASPFVVINQMAVTALGLGSAEEAVGKRLWLNENSEVIVQGVVQNFCYYIYQFATAPLVLQYNPAQFKVLSIKTGRQINDKNFEADMATVWKKNFPPIDFSFSNYQQEMYDRYFPGADMKFMGMLCVVILVIALLGLVGIVTYATEKRAKEIGIRKVLGANVAAILMELSRSFLKLMLIAACIALPLGYIGSSMMVSLFAFNDGVNLSLLVMLFTAIFLLALAVILLQSMRTASTNPVHSLRDE